MRDIRKMKSELEWWLEEIGVMCLREMGVKKGDVVLDFGSGSGNYTIPAARIVGDEGRVYALDKNQIALDELMQKVRTEGLRNVTRINTSGEVEVHLEDGSVDVVLLYDIFWYFPLTDKRLPILLSEIHRVIADKGVLSVYPEHINIEKLRGIIEDAGFNLESEHFEKLIHDNSIKIGQVLNFKKRD